MEDESLHLTKKQRKELKKHHKLEMREDVVKKERIKKLLVWGLVIGAIALTLFGFAKLTLTPPVPSTPPEEVTSRDWVKGATGASASATLIEYSDFQCPACKFYQPLVTQMIAAFPDKLQFVYRHFPLKNTHRNAETAAKAAESAGKQGKFWEMHDMLFDKQDSWSKLPNAKDVFIEYAGVLKLDTNKFKADVDTPEISQKIDADLASGEKAGVDATPTFYLNGQKVENIKSLEDFKKRVEEAIQGK